nr:MAG TPA: hypothetical protein [Caudoviricetes sp.]
MLKSNHCNITVVKLRSLQYRQLLNFAGWNIGACTRKQSGTAVDLLAGTLHKKSGRFSLFCTKRTKKFKQRHFFCLTNSYFKHKKLQKVLFVQTVKSFGLFTVKT